jgi:hypothetical protein
MNLGIRRLEPSDDRRRFTSGNPALDRFFQRFAGQNQFRHHVGVTYIAVAEDEARTGPRRSAASASSSMPNPKRKPSIRAMALSLSPCWKGPCSIDRNPLRCFFPCPRFLPQAANDGPVWSRSASGSPCGRRFFVALFTLRPNRSWIILDPAVERPLECVPRGVRQGATRRRSGSTTTSCNAVGRRAGRAPRAVAAITRRVRRPMTKIVNRVKALHAARSGQLPDLGLLLLEESWRHQPSSFGARFVHCFP